MSVKRYKIDIETQGYVHIGSGNMLGKKDYFESDGKVHFLDQSKFIMSLDAPQRDDYCRFLADSNNRVSLTDYLKQKSLMKIAVAAKLYSLDSGLSQSRSGRRLNNEIAEFVKDPFSCPYVPGSSVKGMLRTALLAMLISENPGEYKQQYQLTDKKDERKSLGNRLETSLLNRIENEEVKQQNAVKDIMRFVSVSDSKPLEISSLCLVRKFDKFSRGDKADHKRSMGNVTKGNYLDGNELNIYRECLRPRTHIELSIDIDERINQYLPFPLDSVGLIKILEQFDQRYRECFLAHFDLDKSGVMKSHDKQTTSAVCYLGGGVDFDSKTVLNYLFTKDSERLDKISRELYNQFPTKLDLSEKYRKNQEIYARIKNAGFPSPKSISAQYNKRDGRLRKAKEDHRHWMDSELGVSPHTLKLGRTSASKSDLPMGKCVISFSET